MFKASLKLLEKDKDSHIAPLLTFFPFLSLEKSHSLMSAIFTIDYYHGNKILFYFRFMLKKLTRFFFFLTLYFQVPYGMLSFASAPLGSPPLSSPSYCTKSDRKYFDFSSQIVILVIWYCFAN